MANIKLTEEQIMKREALMRKYSSSSPGKPVGPKGPGPVGPGHGRKGMKGGRPRQTKAVIKRVFGYLSQSYLKIGSALLCVVISTVATLYGTYLLKPVINGLDDTAAPVEERIKKLSVTLLYMALIYGVGVAASYLQQKIMVGVSQGAIVKIRQDLFNKLQKLPVKYHDTHSHGELMSRFTNDLDSVSEMLNNTIIQLFSGAMTVVGTLIIMFAENWILALITVVSVPLLAKVAAFIGGRSQKYYKGQQKALGAVNGYIEESVTGQKVIKVFCHEDRAVEEFEILSDELRENQIRAQFFGGIMGPVMGNLSQVSYAVTAAVGAIMCLAGEFSIGPLVVPAFTVGGLSIMTGYSRQFSRPINEVSMQVNTIFSALAGAERVFEIMDEEPETDDEQATVEAQVKGDVTLNHVTFGYNPDKVILKDISVHAKPGQKIAFVGSTGAGKTTITNLINRFYDIDSGEIRIDGTEIRNFTRESLRSNIAMVLQDTHLFTGTVRENIRYGRLEATDEEIETAAKTASAHSFIKRLSNGYDTILEGDGANLSQGQRQLLNIARAAVSKAPILILDEATSSVDTRTEKHIEHGMDRLMKDRTTFVIAHRLSTVRDADLIIVLEHGEIVEQGTHDELIKNQGRYFQLYTGAVELD